MNFQENFTQQIDKEIDSSLKKIADMRIFFGHQSVGNNILAGIRDISESREYKIKIIETRTVNENDEAAFFHTNIGENLYPLSKIEDFKKLIENGIGGNVDVAFFKFCYVDFDKTTDVNSIFQKYQKTMEYLKNNNPQTTFVHFTVPLVNARLDVKTFIKKIIGRFDSKLEGNIKRNQFNSMLIGAYEGKEPIFDLATIESTYPDGKRETFKKNGSIFYALVPEYSHDGGHLNELSRKMVALNLLHFIASL